MNSDRSSGFADDSKPDWDWRSDTHTGLGWDSEKGPEVGRGHLEKGYRSKGVEGPKERVYIDSDSCLR